MARIGFIGLGHMGLPMAINLVKGGHEVWGYDLNTPAVEEFARAGGMIAAELSEAGKNKELLITMLPAGNQVKQVCIGDKGLYKTAKPPLHIDCSSIDVETSRELHREAEACELLMVDAPVSGGVAGATAATLTFMVGGKSNAVEQANPFLQAMGKKIYHTGIAGNGQAAKICNNMILGISMIAVSEAFVLANELGLSAQKLFEVVTNSSGQCWAMSQYVPVPNILPNVPANHDYQPGFTSAMMLKDLLLSQQAAKATHIETTLGQLATEIYQRFNDAGFGQLDFSAIIQSIDQKKTD